MAIPRLPTTSYQRHFPGSGDGNNPNIETDGDSLILRRVMIGGKKYDVRIWRWDAKDNLIRLNKDSNFLIETILEVQDLAKTLFDDQFEDPTEVVLWYEDSDPNGPVCKIDRKSLREGDPDKYMDIAADHPVANVMAELHFTFFHSQTTTVSAGENQLISPREVQKDPVPSVNEKEDAAASIKKPKKKKKDSPIPKTTKIHLPPPLSQPAPNSDPMAAARHVATIQDDLDAASEKYAGAEFLTGVTHSELAKYALSPGNNPKLAKAYDVYRAVLVDPRVKGDEADAMRDWLRDLYEAAYKRFHATLKPLYNADTNKQDRDFDDWCKYYAAKAVVGFLLVDKQPIEKLCDLLIATPIPSEGAMARKPNKKSKCTRWLCC